MASNSAAKKERGVRKPNFFARIGLFTKQIVTELRKVVSPTRSELWNWSFAVFVFVVLLMLVITALDFGLGKLMFLIFA